MGEKKKKKDKKREKREKEEGEMTGDEDGEINSGSGKERRDSKEEEEIKNNGQEQEAAGAESGEENGVTDEMKAKEERIAASLRKREEEVKANLAGSLRERDKEREQHLHQEAINGFNALLTDLIRTPDHSWKEAKKLLKKDSRWDMIEGNLEKSERERLFDDHIDLLIAKKMNHTEVYWKNTKIFLWMHLLKISRRKSMMIQDTLNLAALTRNARKSSTIGF